MATSPNYGWLEPDNTDLVKNGALAIRTLGNAIDTTMATMTPKSIVDAKGDLIAASANDTPARLAVGANGETLVADSSTSTGLRYTAGTVQSNPVLNSAYQIWQRGTSISAASAGYTADRWYAQAQTNGTISRQATGDTTNLPNIQYAARVQRTAGATTITDYQIGQSFESVNSIPFAGKTVTLSFYARKGANYSAASSILNVALATGTGTDQNLNTGYTGQATPISSTATLTTTWQRFTYTGTIATTATEMAINYYYTSVGTAGAADYFEITGVQIDVGSVALPFRTNGATLQGELAACQRYYFRTGSGDIYSGYGNGVGKSTTTAYILVNFPQTMRTIPSSTIDGTGTVSNYALYDGTNVTAATAIAADRPQADNYSITVTVASGLTQYRPYVLINNNTSAAFLGFSAEL